MNYAEMSDFEINKLVSARVFGTVISLDDVVLNERSEPFDPCNSWADAGPIIQEENIGITAEWEKCCDECGDTFHTGTWEACVHDDGYNKNHDYTHRNPLRAAMIVFLMMRGQYE